MKVNAKIYEVGGCVRDKFLGRKSNDIDYVFVSENAGGSASEAFGLMKSFLEERNFKIFLVTAECFTIRAKFPNSNEVADFVLARKEVGYEPNSRSPICEVGSLYDDLRRRDFTINALAKEPGESGKIIDYFGGINDINSKILKTPIEPQITFNDDPLRLLRALRFKVVLGFEFDEAIEKTIINYDYEAKMGVVSVERIREELNKMFYFDTFASFNLLSSYKTLSDHIFGARKLKLLPSLKP